MSAPSTPRRVRTYLSPGTTPEVETPPPDSDFEMPSPTETMKPDPSSTAPGSTPIVASETRVKEELITAHIAQPCPPSHTLPSRSTFPPPQGAATTGHGSAVVVTPAAAPHVASSSASGESGSGDASPVNEHREAPLIRDAPPALVGSLPEPATRDPAVQVSLTESADRPTGNAVAQAEAYNGLSTSELTSTNTTSSILAPATRSATRRASSSASLTASQSSIRSARLSASSMSGAPLTVADGSRVPAKRKRSDQPVNTPTPRTTEIASSTAPISPRCCANPEHPSSTNKSGRQHPYTNEEIEVMLWIVARHTEDNVGFNCAEISRRIYHEFARLHPGRPALHSGEGIRLWLKRCISGPGIRDKKWPDKVDDYRARLRADRERRASVPAAHPPLSSSVQLADSRRDASLDSSSSRPAPDQPCPSSGPTLDQPLSSSRRAASMQVTTSASGDSEARSLRSRDALGYINRLLKHLYGRTFSLAAQPGPTLATLHAVPSSSSPNLRPSRRSSSVSMWAAVVEPLACVRDRVNGIVAHLGIIGQEKALGDAQSGNLACRLDATTPRCSKTALKIDADSFSTGNNATSPSSRPATRRRMNPSRPSTLASQPDAFVQHISPHVFSWLQLTTEEGEVLLGTSPSFNDFVDILTWCYEQAEVCSVSTLVSARALVSARGDRHLATEILHGHLAIARIR